MAKYFVKIDAEIREIIPEFLARRRQEVNRLRELLRDQEYINLQMMGHRLKSNSESYGFMQLGLLGRNLENAALAESANRAATAIDEIEDFLNNVELVD